MVRIKTKVSARSTEERTPDSISPVDPFAPNHCGETWWGAYAWADSGIPKNLRQQIQIPGWGAIDHREGQLDHLLVGARQFAQWPWSRGFYICGPVGCGKSLIAACMIREMILTAPTARDIRRHVGSSNQVENWYPRLRFVSVPRLLSRIRNTYGRRSAHETKTEDIIEAYAGADVLVLDDLGAEGTTDWVREQLFELVDERYGTMQPTIFTSNLTLDQLAKRISLRVADRIAEMCGDFIYTIDASSYRVKLRKER